VNVKRKKEEKGMATNSSNMPRDFHEQRRLNIHGNKMTDSVGNQ